MQLSYTEDILITNIGIIIYLLTFRFEDKLVQNLVHNHHAIVQVRVCWRKLYISGVGVNAQINDSAVEVRGYLSSAYDPIIA